MLMVPILRNFADAEGTAVALAAFQLRHNGAIVGNNLKWSDALRGFNNSTPGQDGRREVVRYDSPTFHGFTVIASWGEDDLWDAALAYKGDWNGISVTARAGYGQSNDPGTATVNATNSQSGTACGGTQPGRSNPGASPPLPLTTNYDCSWEGAAATVKHDPTGFYLYGGWGRMKLDSFTTQAAVGGPLVTQTVLDPASTTWFIQPGIEQKWLPLGKTTIFGQYQHDEAGSNSR